MFRPQDEALQPLDKMLGSSSASGCRKGWSGTEIKMQCPIVPSLVARDSRIRKEVLKVGVPIDLLGHTSWFLMTNLWQDFVLTLPRRP